MFNIQGSRGISLCRVSTNRQTSMNENNEKDIPAQKELVRNFVEQEEVILVKEFIEGGVSGFKTKMADRDALVIIKQMAINKEFDVLIVYKADRIGRTSDECPIIIQFLNQHGIRVFATDGVELKSETQIDKIMTYLTFWQNESESIKISQRSTDYQILNIQNGKYRGGGQHMLPYGYTLIKDGDVNLKGKKIGKVEVNQKEAEIVKLIYKLSIENNMGNRAIAAYLNDSEFKNKSRDGNGWNYTTISHILRNQMYKGIYTMHSKLRKQEYSSPIIPELIIIPEAIWDKNQEAIKNRTTKGKQSIKGSTSSHVLVSGLVYCGHCGEKMHVWANHKYYYRKDSQKNKYIQYYYKCKSSYVKNRKECDGQSAYIASRIDNAIEEETLIFMGEVSQKRLTDDFKSDLEIKYNKTLNSKTEKAKLLESKQRQIITLKKEIPNAMSGEGVFSVSELKESLTLIQTDVNNLLSETDKIDNELHQLKLAIYQYIELDKTVYDWNKRYENTDFLGRKAMLNQIIEKVTIFKDGIDIEYKLEIKTFEKNSNEAGITSNIIEGCSVITGSELVPNVLPSALHPDNHFKFVLYHSNTNSILLQWVN